MSEVLRRVPSVDSLLRHPTLRAAEGAVSRPLLVRAVREVLEDVRRQLRRGPGAGQASAPESSPAIRPGVVPGTDELAALAAARARVLSQARIHRVVNATGIVVHTNLGRSLLSERALRALVEAAAHYVTLEIDLASGARASRQAIVRDLLMELTGARAALVVNNNAAAVLVTLNALAEGREVLISRGELVEIGGSFRLPDIMAKSGARMVEVGTTNRTRLADYEKAITPHTAMLLKVHRSNFALRGYVQEASLGELAALARDRSLPLVYDLGSGAMLDLARAGCPRELMPQAALQAGATVVTFSGDKLLGGPQAGIILGEEETLERIGRNPLMRVIRVDKLVLAALEATLAHYRDEGDGAFLSIPTLSMLGATSEDLARRARSLARLLRAGLDERARVEVTSGFSEAGGGALPDEPLPTTLVAVQPLASSAEEVAARLRRGRPPVIAFIREDRVMFDLRTVLPGEEKELGHLVVDAVRGE